MKASNCLAMVNGLNYNNKQSLEAVRICALSVFFTLTAALYSSLMAQSGCTDPQANNYDSLAVDNDGSCLYPPTSQTPQILYGLSEANPNLAEISGQEFGDEGNVWCMLDGGNPNALMELEFDTGNLLRNIEVINAPNVDWEDVAESPSHWYIGEFGNNQNGAREDLKVIRLSKDSITDEGFQLFYGDFIEFSYPEQGDPQPVAQNTTEWDCEAMFWLDNELHLFTKDWSNGQTRHYVLPDSPGVYEAALVEEFDTQGMITGADEFNGTTVLIGYTQLMSTFMYVLWDYQGAEVFSGNKRRIELGFATENGQVEGICLDENGGGLISNERFTIGSIVNVSPRLYQFTITNYMTGIEELHTLEQPMLKLSKSPGWLELQVDDVELVQAFDLGGRLVAERNVVARVADFSELNTGVYIFSVLYKGQQMNQQFYMP